MWIQRNISGCLEVCNDATNYSVAITQAKSVIYQNESQSARTRGVMFVSFTFAVCEVAYAQDVIDVLVVVLFGVWSLFRSVLQLHGDLF